MLAHVVFFTLKDNSAEAKQTLIDNCHLHLKDHPGLVHFSIGTLADEYQREVNDQGFDVALHLHFEDKQSHDKYQVAEEHLKFIEKGKENWDKVRVFDSHVTA